MSILIYHGAAAATAVIMSHDMRTRKILFVEGPHDGRLLNSIFRDAFMPIAASGMQGVVSALDVIADHNANANKPIDVFGFIDRDYLDIRDNANILDRPDILTTLYRDIEIDLFYTQGTKRLLEEKASAGKWTSEKKLLEEILDSLVNLSLLRAYNAYNEKNWDFKIIDLCKYVDTSGRIDARKMESAFRQKNHIKCEEWQEFEDWNNSIELCLKSITRGHDVACVFGQMLRKKIGHRMKDETTGDVVEENLRLAIEKKFIEAYQWFQKLLEWAYNKHIQPTLVTSRG